MSTDKNQPYTHNAEVRERMSQSHLKYNKSPEGIANRQRKSESMRGRVATESTKSLMRQAHSGKNNARWYPFELIVTLPGGVTNIYIFDGDQPFAECRLMFGLVNHLTKLKRGEIVTIKSRSTKTIHTWPIGSTVKLNKLLLD